MDISESILFRDMVRMLEKIKNAGNLALKEKYLRRYYESFKNHRAEFRANMDFPDSEEETGSTSYYSVLRCLIPSADTVRPPYHLKIPTLSKVYTTVLQLPKNSYDANRLYESTNSKLEKDYADTVYSVLLSRCSQVNASYLTLSQVHEMLDIIAADDIRITEKILTRLFEIAPANEQMWFIRLLLKRMGLGIGEQRIFGVLHPLAREFYQRCTNLSRLCCLLADNKLVSFTDGNLCQNLDDAIQVFIHISPMLCERLSGNIIPLLSDKLYIETKMDGERFQLHYRNNRFRYFSRTGVDYTLSFGESYDTGNLTPYLKHLLPDGMKSIVLDGEMMVWDEQRQRFREKGENTDVKHLTGQSTWKPCFVIFDMLYYNGRSFLDISYVHRMHKIKALIKEEPHILEIMKPKIFNSLEDFKTLFQQALNNKEEGVVIKTRNSTYRPGARFGGGWYKLKADYIEGLTSEFDLLVMGGKYNRARTFIESFLVGVLMYKSPTQYEVYSVGKVTNILRQRCELNDYLKLNWRDMSVEPPPLWYHYAAMNAEGRPDVWIDPKDSTCLEIKATDLTPSSAFVLSKALHFPRIIKWRNDKYWSDCMSLNEYIELCDNSVGIKKINKRELRLEDISAERKRIRLMTPAVKRKLGIASYDRKFDPTKLIPTSYLFKGYKFCILSASIGTGRTPEDLKRFIVINGGEIIENPTSDSNQCFCIAGDITYRVKNAIKSGRTSIISIDWLYKATACQDMALTPNDMVFIAKDMKDGFNKLFDKYNDSYYTPVLSVDELRQVLDKISDDEIRALSVSPEEYEQLETELYGTESPQSNIFRNVCGYFFNDLDPDTKIAELVFKLRHGTSVGPKNASLLYKMSFVFINLGQVDKIALTDWLAENIAIMNGVKVVNIAWITNSHNANRILDLCEYTWLSC